MNPAPFESNSGMRASDSDRDHAVAALNAALAEGRLSAQEHGERLDRAYAAKTHAELATVTEDVPQEAAMPVLVPPATPERHRSGITAIFGRVNRNGPWLVEPDTSVRTVLGRARLDFRDAHISSREIRIRHTALFGRLTIVVPRQMRVVDSGSAIFGRRNIGSAVGPAADPDAPLIRLSGLCLLGRVTVRHEA